MTGSIPEPKSEEVVMFRDPSEEADEVAQKPSRPQKILSVTGAKGGAGKSMLAANLAVYLASIGRRVILADADPVGANLHTMLGVARPEAPAPGPDDELEPVQAPPGGPLIDTTVPGLRLFHAELDEPSPGRNNLTRLRLMETLRALPADYVVVDLGSGIPNTLLDFHLSADLAVYVSLPEPTAIENTYRFLRHAFVRYMLMKADTSAVRRAVRDKTREMGGAPPPLDLWRALEEDGDPLADLVRGWMESYAPALVLNQTRLRADLELGDAMRTTVRRRLGIGIEYIGHIDFDDTVWNCVRNRRLLLIESPGSKSAKSVEKIARRLLALNSGKDRWRRERHVPPESHHDLLEVERGATDEEVRRAFKRARDIYASDAVACYGLFGADELSKVRTRLEEAFDVLLDPARRRPYELSVFPMEEDEWDEPSELARGRVSELPPPPLITPDTDFNGALIRQVRESQGVDLRAICNRTKVGLSYLSAIEEDDFSGLPAPVYVRGFVAEVAKFLSLDADQVSRTYVKRYRRYLEERGEAT